MAKTKKKTISKKKNVVSKKKTPSRVKKENGKNGKNGKNQESENFERIYPEISEDKEIAVLYYANGKTLSEIATYLKKGVTTIWNWLHEEKTKKCLDSERNKIYLEARAKTPKMVQSIYDSMLVKAQKGDFQFREGLQYLDKTGYLQTSEDKAEENKKINQLVDQLYNELRERGLDD